MPSAEQRRNEILELLYIYKKCSINDLVERFGVCRRTISSDIVHLTRTHAIISKPGPNGGVMLMDRVPKDHTPYLLPMEVEWLQKKYDEAVTEDDRIVAHSILRRFSR